MKNNSFKTAWFNMLMKMTGMLSALAIIASSVTCTGMLYQPVVPQKLQHRQ